MTVLGSDTFYVVRAVFAVDAVDMSSYWDWDNATETAIVNANVQPFVLSTMSSKEISKDREYEQTLLRVYAPPLSDVLYTDRIRFGTVVYEVYGSPNNWRKLSGAAHHLAFTIRIREG